MKRQFELNTGHQGRFWKKRMNVGTSYRKAKGGVFEEAVHERHLFTNTKFEVAECQLPF